MVKQEANSKKEEKREILLERRNEKHAFVIAVILIIGFLLLLVPPVLRNEINQAKDLAAIFSGWIVAIVGFYFLRNQTEQAATIAQRAGIGAAVDSGNYFMEKFEKAEKNLKIMKKRYEDLIEQYMMLREEKYPGSDNSTDGDG